MGCLSFFNRFKITTVNYKALHVKGIAHVNVASNRWQAYPVDRPVFVLSKDCKGWG
jgi:hypothetical protein